LVVGRFATSLSLQSLTLIGSAVFFTAFSSSSSAYFYDLMGETWKLSSAGSILADFSEHFCSGFFMLERSCFLALAVGLAGLLRLKHVLEFPGLKFAEAVFISLPYE